MQKNQNGGKKLNIILIKKIDEIKFKFNHISSTVAMDLFNKDDLEDFDNHNMKILH